MKKFLLIGLIVGLVFVLVGGGGVVYAAVSNPSVNITLNNNRGGNSNTQPFGYGPGGMMNGYGFGYGPGRMLGRRGLGLACDIFSGSMRSYVVSAFANAVGLTVDQVNSDLSNGQTLTQIANDQGFTGDKLTTLETQVYQAALKQAVSDKVITQSQADQILQLIKNYPSLVFGPGFGLGNCPMQNNTKNQPIFR
jgi:uncharacterized membrane protein